MVVEAPGVRGLTDSLMCTTSVSQTCVFLAFELYMFSAGLRGSVGPSLDHCIVVSTWAGEMWQPAASALPVCLHSKHL